MFLECVTVITEIVCRYKRKLLLPMRNHRVQIDRQSQQMKICSVQITYFLQAGLNLYESRLLAIEKCPLSA